MQLKKIRIASRKSDLARLQAYLVGETLKKNHQHLEIEFLFKESLGDKNLSDPLWKMPEKGVFTEDFHNDLLKDQCDLVVHSWKDLPVEGKAETEIVATLPRADVRDLLLFKKSSLAKLEAHKKLKIFSSSPRRSYNLIPFLKDHLPFSNQDVEFEPVRGNIQTRVRKMMESAETDGLVLAKAAMDRLLLAQAPEFAETANFLGEVLTHCQWMVLPLSKNPAAAAQGALAVEILKSRSDLKELLSEINCPEDFACVVHERQRLASYGGGCHQKIGITQLSRSYGDIEFLRGLTDSGEVLDSKINSNSDRPLVHVEKSDDHFIKVDLISEIPNTINALYVSHPSAIPEELNNSEQFFVVWTAGGSTWKALCKKGIWVNGSSDGLGEKEDYKIDALVRNLKLSWGKLAHSDAVTTDKTLIATYQLKKRSDRSFLANKAAYFWKSGSLFSSALEQDPKLMEKQHYCGPGHSFDEIRKICPDVQILWPSIDSKLE